MNYSRIIFALSFLLTVGTARALTIVHMETQIGAATTDLYFELYDDIAPGNVSNFIGYVTRGDYNNSFFQRKAQYADTTPFVVQGGSFSYVPQFDCDAKVVASFGATSLVDAFDPVACELGVRPIGERYFIDLDGNDVKDTDINGDIIFRVNDGLKRIPVAVPVDPSAPKVLSEASLPNLRGTIAMALVGGDVNSATNGWFINLFDNTQLDPTTNGGGFTVFGKILGDGINFFDTVNDDLSTYPLASNVNQAFEELPVVNYEPFTRMLGENLVRLNSASEVLKIDVTEHDFGFIDIGQTAPSLVITLTVSPQWTSNLVFLDTFNLPSFGVISNCADAPVLPNTSPGIPPGGSCQITVTFAPTTPDIFSETLNLSFDGISLPDLPIKIAGSSRTLPKVASSTGNNLDFQFVFPGTPETQNVVITNQGQQALTIDSIAIDNTVNFTSTDTCAGVTLQSTETCSIDVTIAMPEEGLKTANMVITTNAPESQFIISLQGTGSFSIVPDIDAEAVHDFGDLLNGSDASGEITLINRGVIELTNINPFILGGNASDFTVSSNCTAVLAAGDSCVLTVGFIPSAIGARATTLIVASDDPETPEFNISLVGTSSSDPDNIPDAEEDAAPNNGDGDGDTVKDRLQSNIVSFRTTSGKYMTLTTSSILNFIDTAVIENPSPGDVPNAARLDNGLVRFTFGPTTTTASYKIGMILPIEQPIGTVYQYGPTPDNAIPHWYEFMFDANTGTGAQIFNNVTMTSPNGRPMQRNVVQIWYGDGRRGDDDLTVNGQITSTGGVSIASVSSEAASSLNGYLALMTLTLLLAFRRSASVCEVNAQ